MARHRRSVKHTVSNSPAYVPDQVITPCHAWSLIRRMAIHQTTTFHWTLAEDIAACRELGFQAIGAWRYKIDDFGEERAGDLLKEEGLTASSLSWTGGFAFSDRESFRNAVADAEDALVTAKYLDANCLVVVPGSRGSYTANHAMKIIADALQQLGEKARQSQIQIALQPIDPEFAGDTVFLKTLDQQLELLALCKHPNVGLNLDLFHLRNTPNLLERIPELLPWIRLVQLSDCVDPRSDLDRCLPGQGQIPIHEVVETLEAVGYRGFYEISLPSPAIWKQNYFDVLRMIRHEFLDSLVINAPA